MRTRTSYIVFLCVLVWWGPAMGEPDCASVGLDSYDRHGPAVAMKDFVVAYERSECQTNSLLKLNYARTMEAVVKDGEDQLLLCQALELLIDVQADSSVPRPLMTVATNTATDLIDRCQAVSKTMDDAQFQAASQRAIENARAGRREQAILEWRALVRVRNERIEPYRALCRLLEKTDRKAEAERRCAAWKFLVGQKETQAISEDTDLPAWTLFAVSGGLMAAAGLTYALTATAHSELLEANRRAIDAAEERNRLRFDQASEEQANLTDKMGHLHTTTWVLLGAGLVCGGVGTYLWWDDNSVEFTWNGTSVHWALQW